MKTYHDNTGVLAFLSFIKGPISYPFSDLHFSPQTPIKQPCTISCPKTSIVLQKTLHLALCLQSQCQLPAKIDASVYLPHVWTKTMHFVKAVVCFLHNMRPFRSVQPLHWVLKCWWTVLCCKLWVMLPLMTALEDKHQAAEMQPKRFELKKTKTKNRSLQDRNRVNESQRGTGRSQRAWGHEEAEGVS